jgi:hypothetical protein
LRCAAGDGVSLVKLGEKQKNQEKTAAKIAQSGRGPDYGRLIRSGSALFRPRFFSQLWRLASVV